MRILILSLLALLTLGAAPEPVTFDGYLSAYGRRPTEGTLAYRQEHGQIPDDVSDVDVFVAVPDCGLIGRRGELHIDGQVYRAMVFDCAGRGSHEWMLRNAIAAEVDYYFWRANPQYVGTMEPVRVVVGGP